MPPAAGIHPAEASLVAYAQGRLPEDRMAAVARHLEKCDRCQAVVHRAPGDSFINGLRSPVQPSNTPMPHAGATRGPAPAVPVDPAELPAELRDSTKYKVLRQLGQGGMGVVYLTQHEIMDRLVAVKVINQTLVGQGQALERFQREVKAAAKLDHPNIVRAYDSEQVGSLHLLAMEYVEGLSLADVIAKKGPLPVALACRFALQVALGLQHAHEQGMVHRDLKPQNLMLTPKGTVKILDFGLAKLAGERRSQAGLTQENMAMGTPEYMAPEQAMDTRTADIRADIYSLGCTLFFLLTGRSPFPAGDDGQVMPVLLAHLKEPPPLLTDVRPEVPEALADLVGRMLAKTPGQRPQTPNEVAEGLAACSRKAGPGKTLAAEDDDADTPPGRTWTRWPFVVGAVFGVGLVVAAGIVLVWERRGKDGSVMTVSVAFEPTQDQTIAKSPPTQPPQAPSSTPPSVPLPQPPPTPLVQPSEKPWNDSFVPLFNGNDVDGWKCTSGNAKDWQMDNGTLRVRGTAEGYLTTKTGDFADFHLRANVRYSNGANSGIFFRTSSDGRNGYEAELRDDPRLNAASQTGTFLIHKDRYVEALCDISKAHATANKWFRYEILAKGPEVHISINGVPVVKLRDRSYRLRRGHLSLQVFPGSVIEFQNVEIRRLRPESPTAVENHAHGEFVSLFNGHNLEGWLTHDAQDGGWSANDGVLVGRGKQTHLYTERGDYTDVHIRAEVRLNQGGDSGIIARSSFGPVYRLKQTTYPIGYEGQLDNSSGPDKWRTGSLFIITPQSHWPARLQSDAQPNEWFDYEMKVIGDRIIIVVNGEERHNFPDPWRKHSRGHIALQVGNDKTTVEFRNIAVRELRAAGKTDGEAVHRDRTIDPRLQWKDWKGDGRRKWIVWVDEGVWHVRFPTHANNTGQRSFAGKIELENGTISSLENVIPFGHATGDIAIAADRKSLEIDVDTQKKGAQAGCDFRVSTGTSRLKFNLSVDGKESSPERVFVGQRGTNPATNPFWLTVSTAQSVEAKPAPPEPPAKAPAPPSSQVPPASERGFVPLFNGQDLNGWKEAPTQPGIWSVKDGVLIGRGKQSHLYSERDDYKDIHVKAVLRINNGGDSGIYFRSSFGPGRPVDRPTQPLGYEAQVNTAGDYPRTGSLYIGTAKDVERIPCDAGVRPGDWFDYEVIAVDNAIAIKVNGKEVLKHPDKTRAHTKGHIALQCWNEKTVVEFRKIEVREVDRDKALRPSATP